MNRWCRAGLRSAALLVVMVGAHAAPAPAPTAPNAPAASAVSAAAHTDDDGRIRIQLVARDQVDISSEISAKIASMPFRDGDAFRAGQTLVSLDCSLYAAQLHKAQAEADAAAQLKRVDDRLAQLHSIGELDVQQAEGRAKASAAEVAYMRATVRKCGIAAPFDGRVVKRSASAQQFAEPGKPLLTIVDTGHLELKMIVPSKWLAQARPCAHGQRRRSRQDLSGHRRAHRRARRSRHANGRCDGRPVRPSARVAARHERLGALCRRRRRRTVAAS
jgi:multidrug efflux pump subunit AcrA (membrane-fusion protein)